MTDNIDKQVVEMPDGEKRFDIVQELHKEGYRTIQDTPNKVVLVKFVDENKKFLDK